MRRLLLPLASGLGHLRRAGGAWRGEVLLPGRRVQDVAADPGDRERLWAGTFGAGLWRSADGGDTWERADDGIGPDAVTAVAVEDTDGGARLWAGTEPSELYVSEDGGDGWRERPALRQIPSRNSWSYPPRPWTHHVRWIEPDPHAAGRIFVGIELGGVMRSLDAGRSFEDRKPGAKRDCHALRTHLDAPGRVYETGGTGYAESRDGGDTWRPAQEGLEHRYAWGLAVDRGDPDTVLLSAADGPGSAYDPASAETHVYRRRGDAPWERVTAGLPEPAGTRILALAADPDEAGVLWATNGQGLYRSEDAGTSWEPLSLEWPEGFEPDGCRGLLVLQ